MNKGKIIEEMAIDIMRVSSLPLEISGAIATDLAEIGYRKQVEAEWMKHYFSTGIIGYVCSNKCGECLTEVENEELLPNYCPNCGAKMKGAE